MVVDAPSSGLLNPSRIVPPRSAAAEAPMAASVQSIALTAASIRNLRTDEEADPGSSIEYPPHLLVEGKFGNGVEEERDDSERPDPPHSSLPVEFQRQQATCDEHHPSEEHVKAVRYVRDRNQAEQTGRKRHPDGD